MSTDPPVAVEGDGAKYDRVFPLGAGQEGMEVAALHLRRPFTPEAVKWKVQASWESGCLVVPYIDARLVVERLNHIVPDNWQEEYTSLGNNFLLCELTVAGVTHKDVGEGAGKTGYSDALKRVAVRFGVGVSLYAIPKVTINRDDSEKRDMIREGRPGKDGKKPWVLTPAGERGLREWYAKWLEAKGERNFGPVLDHGDTVDEQTGEAPVGDVDDDAAEDVEQAPVQLVETERAEELRADARVVYAEIVKRVGRSEYPPGQFQAGLEAAGGSEDELMEFVRGLEDQLALLRAAAAAA